MTATPSSPTKTSLSLTQRHEILGRVLTTLHKRFYAPERLNDNWRASVERHRPAIEAADSAANFEQAMSDLLTELHTSHLGFFHRSARRTSSKAALSATYLADETVFGRRWIFQDVHSGGAAALAGIKPGDILLSLDGKEMKPPEHPVFVMGEKSTVEINVEDERKLSVGRDDLPQPVRKLLLYRSRSNSRGT